MPNKTTLSTDEFEKGYRMVDGKVTHLRRLFPNESAKLKEFLKVVPYVTRDEQVDMLCTGSEFEIECAIRVSFRMTNLALEEYKKFNQTNILNFFRKKDPELRELFEEKLPCLSRLQDEWMSSFEVAVERSGNKLNINKDGFLSEIDMCHDQKGRKVDEFLPNPYVFVRE